MTLTGLLHEKLDQVQERLRPELKLSKSILSRETGFIGRDSSRKNWVLNNVYLAAGDLESLKQHPGYSEVSYRIAYYVGSNCKRHKRVTRSADISGTEDARELAERRLKLALHSMGVNAGVFYTTYTKGKRVYAEAVPAILTGE
jgi:hypothetical protein